VAKSVGSAPNQLPGP